MLAKLIRRRTYEAVLGKTVNALSQRIERIEGWFILLSGWSRNAAAFFAGAVSSLAMPPFDFVFALFLTVPVLVWLIDGASSEPSAGIFSRLYEGFKPGFFFGFGYFVAGLWWIGNAFLVEAETFAWALPIAVVAVPAVLALFWGCATALARLFWFGEARRLFMLAGCLALFEYFRGFVATGFPWNAIGYAAYFNPQTMQTASVLGIYGVTAFVILVAALPIYLATEHSSSSPKRYVLLFLWLALVTVHVGYGVWRLDSKQSGFVENVNLRLVQPAIDQAEKFDPKFEAELFQRYLDLSVTEAGDNNLSGVTHLIWPESAFPFLLTERRDALSSIAAMLPEGTSLITGAARAESGSSEGNSLVFNSVYVIDDKGIIVSAADKVHLVPFGEYLPLQEIVESLGLEQLTQVQGGFTAGNSRKLLSTGLGPSFLPLVCYEIIFSGDIWKQQIRPGWILNLTNDAWFGITPGPYQHERKAIVRGVEEGLPVVRAANSGVSGIYSAYGESVVRLELAERGVLDAGLPPALSITIYAVYGNIIFWSVLAGFFAIGLIPVRKT